MVSYIDKQNTIVCIVGMGYVGFPLLEAFSHHLKTIGFDINQDKVQKLNQNYPQYIISSDPTIISQADFIIVAVPTPVEKSKQPELSPVKSASKTVGQHLKKGSIIVLESTVYPGVTEDIMAPILEKESGLLLGKDFKIGYSPERVNPGDTEHTIDKITKIVSGIDEETTDKLASLYGLITTVFQAQNIKTAEAAKVIENIQRDLNIALMNELSMIFSKLKLDTNAILDAASTKWNFIRFSPGLVGGHCIPVDPYYLVFKANELGFHPKVILAGRATNDHMPKHVVELCIKALNDASKVINGSNILLMGLTFKENVEDTRETPVRDIIHELKEFKCNVYAYDPLLQRKDIEDFNVNPLDRLPSIDVTFDCVIITVVHDVFKAMGFDTIMASMNKNPILIDVRGKFKKEAEAHDIIYRCL